MDPVTGNLIMIIGFVVGSGLILLEAFMPGFGVAGIVGIILEIVAIVLTASMYGTTWAVIATFAVLLLIGLAVFLSYRSAIKGRLSKSPLVLKNEESAQPVSDAAAAMAEWISRVGTVATPLRPAGFIEIDGTRLNAATAGDFLEKGASVQVTGVEGDHLVVCRKTV